MSDPRPTDLVSIARAEVDRVGKIGPALTHRLCDEIKRLHAQVERQRKTIADAQRDYSETVRDAATEARWQERQGEDYGSY